MDWNVVIERNRERLKDILARLVAMAGLGGNADPASPSPLRGGDRGGGTAGEGEDTPEDGDTVIPRRIHRAILAVLRPAESAARRLIIVAARDLVLPPLRPRKPRPKPTSIFVRPGEMRTGIVLPYGVKPGDILPNLARPQRARTLSLPLTDTLRGLPRRSTAGAPRIWAPGFDDPYRPRKSSLPDYLVGATRLALRLQALGRVLDDLPKYARRFARWRARVTAQNRDTLKLRRSYPLRPGRPPGGRRTRSMRCLPISSISPSTRWNIAPRRRAATARDPRPQAVTS